MLPQNNKNPLPSFCGRGFFSDMKENKTDEHAKQVQNNIIPIEAAKQRKLLQCFNQHDCG